MKTALKSLLATIHLAPLSQVEHLDDLAGRAAVPLSELKERMAKLGADVDTWKRHYEASVKTSAEWKQGAPAPAQRQSVSQPIPNGRRLPPKNGRHEHWR
jgi:hypothetical protein